jgi:hypothetical protein
VIGRPAERREQSPGQLVRLAMRVPAVGDEAASWQVRNLAELALQALCTGSGELLAHVDIAAATVGPAEPPLVARLRAVRAEAGAVPGSYPRVRRKPAEVRPAGPQALAAARQLARLAGRVSTHGQTGEHQVRLVTAADVRAHLDRLACTRPFGLGHQCRPLLLAKGAVWRSWFLDGSTPVFAFPCHPHPTGAAAVMYGLHVGVHLDHLAALVATRGAHVAARLQFGRGLLVAEAVAMAVELATLVDPLAQLAPAEREFLRQAVGDRIARLPGPPAAPASGSSAGRREFVTLPTLAESYVLGPLRLARRGFQHQLIPPHVRDALVGAWRAHPSLATHLPAE